MEEQIRKILLETFYEGKARMDKYCDNHDERILHLIKEREEEQKAEFEKRLNEAVRWNGEAWVITESGILQVLGKLRPRLSRKNIISAISTLKSTTESKEGEGKE